MFILKLHVLYFFNKVNKARHFWEIYLFLHSTMILTNRYESDHNNNIQHK